jgi:hypothetical protein
MNRSYIKKDNRFQKFSSRLSNVNITSQTDPYRRGSDDTFFASRRFASLVYILKSSYLHGLLKK